MIGLLVALACGRPAPVGPNVLLVTLDTTRADHLGLYGYFRDTSPHLDALAADGVVFDQCLVPMAVTLPSHTSMLTGTFPIEHGILSNNRGGMRWVRAPMWTLARWLRDRGYRTGGFVSGAPLRAGTGVEEGFDVWTEPPPGEAVRRGEQATDDALRFLHSGHDPFFAWIHLFDAHGGPAPAAWASRFVADERLQEWMAPRRIDATLVRGGDRDVPVERLIDRYDAQIRYMDEQIGRLVADGRARGWLRDTLVVVLGDHGEGLGQHGLSAHGYVWEEQIRAPFLLVAPGLAPRRVAEPVSTVDLVPTLLSLLHLPGEEVLRAQAAGRDALTADGSRPIFSQSSEKQRRGHPKAVALTQGTWRYARDADGKERLYDLAADPWELADLAPREPDRVAGMRAVAEEEEARQVVRGRAFGAGKTAAMTDAERAELRELGYVE
jgi:arylsulfatase A-like enzyme